MTATRITTAEAKANFSAVIEGVAHRRERYLVSTARARRCSNRRRADLECIELGTPSERGRQDRWRS